MHKGETLTQFIIEEQRRTNGSGDFSACWQILKQRVSVFLQQ